MKSKMTPYLFIAFLIFSVPAFSQNFTELQHRKDVQINGLLVSYSVVNKGSKKGSDLYKLTATITNQGNDYLRIYSTAPKVFVKKPENALAYFQFTNATGKALSATSAHFYPKPMHIKVPYKCKKCPPIAKDEDPYNHYTKSVIIGTQFVSGSTMTKTFNIRVAEGNVPSVRVMIY